MAKVLSIDFGLKRTGLAISDDAKFFAFGLDTVDSAQLMDRIQQLMNSDGVDELVLGLPKQLNNTDAHVTQNVYLLEEALKSQFPQVKISLLDERFTSKMASAAMHTAGATKKQKREKGLIDKVSATIILQSYLDQR